MIENGVSKAILKAEMIELAAATQPQDEQFVITTLGHASVINLIGRDRLEDLGSLDPSE